MALLPKILDGSISEIAQSYTGSHTQEPPLWLLWWLPKAGYYVVRQMLSALSGNYPTDFGMGKLSSFVIGRHIDDDHICVQCNSPADITLLGSTEKVRPFNFV